MAEQIVTELTVDEGKAVAGLGRFEAALAKAGAAQDAQVAKLQKMADAVDPFQRALANTEPGMQRHIRNIQRIVEATDPVAAVTRKVETAMRQMDAAVQKGAISQQSAARIVEQYRQTLDGTAAMARRFQQELDQVRGALDRTYSAQQRLSQQQAVLNQALRQGQITAGEYHRMMATANQQTAGMGEGTQQAAGGMALLGLATRGLAPVMAAALSGGAVIELGKRIVEAADAVAMLQGRFTALSGSAAQGATAVQQVFDIAAKTGASVDETGQAFARFYLASKTMGVTQAEAARLVETVQKLGVIGGASAASMSAGALQLGQALASGTLRGDELNSILENIPLVAQQIADGLGVNIGQLRTMGAEGQLTADKVFGALQKGAADADRQFAAMPVTVSRASGEAAVAWTGFAKAIDDSIGLSRTLASSLQGIADLLRRITAGLSVTPQSVADKLTQQRNAVQAELTEMRQHPEAWTEEIKAREKIVEEMNRQIDANRELALQQSRLTAQRKLVEQDAAAAAAAAAAETKAVKERVEAQKQFEKILLDLDPKAKAAKDFDSAIMGLDKAFSEGLIPTQAEYNRLAALAVKAFDEQIKKADGVTKKVREKKISYDSLHVSIRDATEAALEHEQRMASGSKGYLEIAKADDALADSLTKRFIPASQKAAAEIMTFDRLLEQGKITQETYAAAVAETTRELQDSDPAYKAAQQAAADYTREVERMVERASDRVVDLGADALFDTLTGRARDFWDTFKDFAIRTFSQIAAEALIRPIVTPIDTALIAPFPEEAEEAA